MENECSIAISLKEYMKIHRKISHYAHKKILKKNRRKMFQVQ